MTKIQFFRDGVSCTASRFLSIAFRVARFVVQTNTGRLSVALIIIASTVYWWKNRSPSLQERVAQLETELEKFWHTTALDVINHPRVTTLNALEQQIKLKLTQLQKRVSQLPTKNVPPELELRIKSLQEVAVTPHKPPQQQAQKKTSCTYEQAKLETMDWSQVIDTYEECANQWEGDHGLAKDLKQYQIVLIAQISEVYKSKTKQELFSCLLRLHGIGRRLLVRGAEIDSVGPTMSSKQFGGLARTTNNSCYLATALQLFRALDNLKGKFDSAKNALNDPHKNIIQGSIHDMLCRMDKGETIPVKEGQDLQQLMKEAGIIEGAVFGMYDAGEIAARLLYLMGFELPTGKQIIKRISSANKELSRKEEEYRPAIVVSPADEVDVGSAIQQLIKERSEEVIGDGEKINHTYTVTDLPNFMVVEFLGRDPKLSNVEKFDDPFDKSYQYELIFGMENTGAHWIAHVLCEGNKWMTANDAYIHEMSSDSLSGIHRGYYVRKAK